VTRRLRLSVLLSGSGRTLQNFVDRIEAGSLNARLVHVLGSLSSAYGLERAEKHGIPTSVVKRKDFEDDDSFSEAVWRNAMASAPDLVALAGFMVFLKIPPGLIGKVMNIHPALLPSFGGKGMYGHFVHEAVLEYGCKLTGCTVHFCDNVYDHGPIILQKPVPVLEDDSPDVLAARVFEKECEAYPEAINLFAAGRLVLQGRCVKTLPEPR